jgi:hypothetical protein
MQGTKYIPIEIAKHQLLDKIGSKTSGNIHSKKYIIIATRNIMKWIITGIIFIYSKGLSSVSLNGNFLKTEFGLT